ncbi:MAG: phosphoribosyltransferase family protein [Frankia sp.]
MSGDDLSGGGVSRGSAALGAGVAGPAPVTPPVTTPESGWLWDELGLAFTARTDVVGVGIEGLVGLALRRNPRRAHLLVSRVLGKHLPVEPGTALAVARVLAHQIPAALGGPPPAGCDPTATDPPLVLGYCETATSLGHAVADAIAGSDYLHTTRRREPGRPPLLEFDEAHSHAAFHWLIPTDAELVRRSRPLVLVDDELTTGRTALGTIRILHAFAPHPSYVVATIFDSRSADARAAFDALAAELGVPVVVVSLLAGELRLPEDIAARAAAVRASYPSTATVAPGRSLAGRPGMGGGPARRHGVRRLAAEWPADLPDGGRHGWTPGHRERLADVVEPLAKNVAAGLRPHGRTLVLGTEELMYVPLRLAAAIADCSDAQVVYHSTTRSPVYVLDVEGYAVRAQLTFPAPDDSHRVSHVYNVRPGLYDDIVLVVDGHPDAVADGVRLAGLLGELRSCADVTVVTLPAYRPPPAPRP